MPHPRNELAVFSMKDLEEMAKIMAKMKLVGPMYVGSIGEQRVRWLEDGGIEVVTPHTPQPLKEAR